MKEVNINTLVSRSGFLNKNIPDDIIIVGKIDRLYIENKYEKLNLSNVECNEIYYRYQEDKSIKNHILPNSLKLIDYNYNLLKSLPYLPNSLIELHCSNNRLTSLPYLPNSLQKLNCSNNQLTSLPNLPNSLIELHCHNNRLKSLPDGSTSLPHLRLPDSLKKLNYSGNNELISLPKLPNSLEILRCYNNQLASLPDFTHIKNRLELNFYQDLPISYIPYNKNIYLNNSHLNKIIIEDYPYNPITNQKELDRYMKYVKNYQINRIKSARK